MTAPVTSARAGALQEQDTATPARQREQDEPDDPERCTRRRRARVSETGGTPSQSRGVPGVKRRRCAHVGLHGIESHRPLPADDRGRRVLELPRRGGEVVPGVGSTRARLRQLEECLTSRPELPRVVGREAVAEHRARHDVLAGRPGGRRSQRHEEDHDQVARSTRRAAMAARDFASWSMARSRTMRSLRIRRIVDCHSRRTPTHRDSSGAMPHRPRSNPTRRPAGARGGASRGPSSPSGRGARARRWRARRSA